MLGGGGVPPLGGAARRLEGAGGGATLGRATGAESEARLGGGMGALGAGPRLKLGGGGGALEPGPREMTPDSEGLGDSFFFASESKISSPEPFLSAAILGKRNVALSPSRFHRVAQGTDGIRTQRRDYAARRQTGAVLGQHEPDWLRDRTRGNPSERVEDRANAAAGEHVRGGNAVHTSVIDADAAPRIPGSDVKDDRGRLFSAGRVRRHSHGQ